LVAKQHSHGRKPLFTHEGSEIDMTSISKKRALIGSSYIMVVFLSLALLITLHPFTRATKAHADAPTPNFQRVPIVGQDTLDAGFTGGEGGQWIRSIKWSPADPNFLMMGTDVGGVYRSVDGGDNWQIAMIGWNDRGGNTFAFDPHNGNRVLGIGANGTDFDGGNKVGGVYLSTDKAASWTQTLPLSSGNDNRDSIAYDPSTYDPNLGYTTTAYYVTQSNGIYKTTDGGSTWTQINTGYSGLRIAVHPTKGYVYLTSDQNPCCGTQYGFYKSTDGGVTFTNKASNYTYGLAVSPAAPDDVWISRYDGVLVSTDAGETFTNVGNTGLPTCCTIPLQNVTASPANPNYLSVWADLGNYDWRRYYTTDGGQTWGTSDYGHYNSNFRQTKYELLPYNVRDGRWAYSPTDPNVVFSTGGDWITKSTDAGANYTWHGNGENAIFVSTFNFNPNHPNDILMASKDYNSYASINGGKSWTYGQTGFDFGGYGFGGFALDDNVMWLGNVPNSDSSGSPILEESKDGGQTWFKPQYNGADITVCDGGVEWDLVSYADPTNNDVGFIGKWRTTDHGATWAPMTGVEDVFTSNPTGNRELYGKNGKDIVTSSDHGTTWTVVATAPDYFRQLAYDQVNNRFWLAMASFQGSRSDLVKIENGVATSVPTPKDQYNSVRVTAVAVDPTNPNNVYAGNDANIYAANNAVVGSTDGGQTWTNLTPQTPLATNDATSGPREVWWMEFNPQTNELWMSTNCFGIWKIAAPGSGSNPTPVAGNGTGLKGDYFNNTDLSGSPAYTRTDATINFDWDYIPAPGVNYDSFSVRWTGKVEAPVTGNYTFSMDINDGARLWVNGQLLIDYWNYGRWDNYPAVSKDGTPITLTGGQQYDIKIEFYENDYGATAKLYWTYPGQAKQIIPQSYLYPAS
jgi:photosystem II stability/assembly factor-like uncharacterized protein